MAIFSELRDTLEGLESRMGDVDIDVLLTAIRGLDDDEIVGSLAGAAAVVNCAERMLTVCAGVVAERSRREAGHSGLAASRGHRNPVSLVQSIVGGTRMDAARAVRLGESLVEGADAA
ncbi:MAG: HNH endonuclease signature motif containing protein, partial [Microbacterium sp.]